MKKNRTIETGTVDQHIWLGRHEGFYEPVRIGFDGRQMHILRFTVKEAEMVIEMLKEEVRLKKHRSLKNGVANS